jgi:hypothetical protein
MALVDLELPSFLFFTFFSLQSFHTPSFLLAIWLNFAPQKTNLAKYRAEILVNSYLTQNNIF